MLGLGLSLTNLSVLNSQANSAFWALRNLGRVSKWSFVGDSQMDTAGAPGGTEGTGPWSTKATALTNRIIGNVFNQPGANATWWLANRRYDHFVYNPDAIGILFAENAYGSDAQMNQNKLDVETMVLDAIARDVKVIVLFEPIPTTTSLGSGASRALDYIAWINYLAIKYSQVVVCPGFYSLWGSGEVSTYTWEGTHCNFEGVAQLQETFFAWLWPYVSSHITITEQLALFSSGSKLINRPSFSAPVGASGFGSPTGTYTSSTGLTPGNGAATNSVDIVCTGGDAVRAYDQQNVVATDATHYHLATIKIRIDAGDLSTDWIHKQTMWFSNVAHTAPSDQVQVTAAGEFNSQGRWMTFALIAKGQSGHTRVNFRHDLVSKVVAVTDITGANVEMTEALIVDLNTCGVDFGLPA